MMGRSSQCYILSFMEIELLVPEKKGFEGFLPYMAWRPSWSCDQHCSVIFFISLYLKAFIKNLVQNDTVVSEKIKFDFFNVQDLGPWSRNDLDLQYSHTFINSIRCLLLPIFSSLVAIISNKNPLFSLFPMEKPKLPNLNLP